MKSSEVAPQSPLVFGQMLRSPRQLCSGKSSWRDLQYIKYVHVFMCIFAWCSIEVVIIDKSDNYVIQSIDRSTNQPCFYYSRLLN